MNSTLNHAIETLRTFGIDVEPERCDVEALRADADDIREGITPLHLSHLSACPPRFAADLLETVAEIIGAHERGCDVCGMPYASSHYLGCPVADGGAA